MELLIIIHIKIYKNNFFLVISDSIGKVLLSISAGYFGFKHIKKRSVEALNRLLLYLQTYI